MSEEDKMRALSPCKCQRSIGKMGSADKSMKKRLMGDRGKEFVRCPKCNRLVPKKAEVCWNCGRDLNPQQERRCPRCHSAVSKDSENCWSCGKKL